MKKNISNYPFPNNNSPIHKVDFIVDMSYSRSGNNTLKFVSCNFYFTEAGSLNFNGITFINCTFIGLGLSENYISGFGMLLFENCPSKDIKLQDSFKKIIIRSSHFRDFFDSTNTFEFSISNSTISNFTIEGEAQTLETKKVLFNNELIDKKWKKRSQSLWSKKIDIEAVCTNTIFNKTKINPFYLAVKCSDKSSLDLSNAIFSDDWSRLRKKYSGINLSIIVILTIVFFLPILTESFVLMFLSTINKSVIINKELPLWEILLFGGKLGFQKFLYAILTSTLIIYNIGRFYLTISISRLREEERFLKDSNFNLVSIHPEKYKWLNNLDHVLIIMFWVSFFYSILKLIDTLKLLVPVID